MLSWDEEEEDERVAEQLRQLDLQLEERERTEVAQLMADNREAPKLRGTRIWFEREGRFLRVTMRIAYPLEGPIPPNGVGQGAWHSIAAFCSGWLRAAGLGARRGSA